MSRRAPVYRFADVRVDAAAARVFRDDRPIPLEPKAFDVLRFLLENPGRLVEKQELLDAVWNDTIVTENAMTRVVAHLRKSLGDNAKEARYIETVPTRGYRFIADVVAEDGVPIGRGARRLGLVLLAGVALGAGSMLVLRPGPLETRDVRAAALPLNGATIEADWAPVLALSPRGDRLAFVGRETPSPRRRLYLRFLDSDVQKPLPGTEDGFAPAFSPDGEWISFFSEDRLMRVSVEGGAVETILGPGTAWPMKRRAQWLSNESILLVYADSGWLEVQRVTVSGERSALARAAIDPDEYVSWVDPLRDGGAFLVSTRNGPNPEDARIEILDVESGMRRKIASGHQGSLSASGQLLYVVDGALIAAPFDEARLELAGNPVMLVDGVLSDALAGMAQFTVSAEGTLAYLPPSPGANLALSWTDREGRVTAEETKPFRFNGPVLSPEGRRVAFRNMASRETRSLWLLALETGEVHRVPIEGNPVSFVWHPSGKQVAFAWDRDSLYNVFALPIEGGGEPLRLTESPRRQFPKSFSPDGSLLAYEEESVLGGPRDVWFLPIDGGVPGQAVPFLREPFDEKEPAFSPDGKLLAFQSNASGRFEIEVASVVSGKRRQVSIKGGREPRWTRAGREIVYRSGNQIFAVEVSGVEEPEFSYPRALFTTDFLSPGHRNYDVTSDGERFLGVRVEGLEPYDSVRLLFDWERKGTSRRTDR